MKVYRLTSIICSISAGTLKHTQNERSFDSEQGTFLCRIGSEADRDVTGMPAIYKINDKS